VLFDLRERLLVDERTLIRLAGEAVANPQLLHRGDELAREFVIDLVLHDEAVRAHAGLARVAVLARDRARDGGVEVGVIENEERRVAAELQRDLLHGARALRHQ
jgi:ParB family chromosome partitioning protein